MIVLMENTIVLTDPERMELNQRMASRSGREPPGKYDDLYGKKKIRATGPVIVFCGLESWEVVFAWTGKEVEKVQLSD